MANVTTGFSNFGTPQQAGGTKSIAKAHDYPGGIWLQCYNPAGTLVERFLWIDSDGVLRINATYPTDQDSDGTVVGSQS